MRRFLFRVLILPIFISNSFLPAEQGSPFPRAEDLSGRKPGEAVIKPGTFLGYEADFGVILVPENRNRQDSRIIRLAFIRIHALEELTQEPVFLLNGGPGRSNIRGILSPDFFRNNDLVIIGYRGTHDSSVSLEAPEVGRALAMESPLSPVSLKAIRRVIRANYNRFTESGIDINGYTVLEVVDDLECIRRFLGYDRINLFSSSYGTILAHLYCLKYPALVHRNLMVGASNLTRSLVREPETVSRVLKEYGALWRADPEARERSPDIIATMKKVLGSLPRSWNDICIDHDKLKIAKRKTG